MKENGEKFADLCELNNLVIGGSTFAHKRTKGYTKPPKYHLTMSPKSNRLSQYHQEFQTISSRCSGEKGSGCNIRPPPSDCENQA
jgi:hypothetical protein